MQARARSAATLGVLVMLCLFGILIGIAPSPPTSRTTRWSRARTSSARTGPSPRASGSAPER